MNPIIRDKLDQVDDLFPAERIQQSKHRWDAIWGRRRVDGRYPFAFAPMLYQPYDDLHTPLERLTVTLDDLISRGSFRDDTIPSVFPGCRQSTLPNLFGAQETVIGNDVTTARIVTRPEDVDDLEWEIRPGTVAHNWIEGSKRILDETDGRIPIHVVDMQGPFDAAAQLCGYDTLILMAYEDQARYRRFLEMMSDAFCAFWEAQMAILGDRFVATHLFGWDWVPPGPRATMSIDSLVMCSPAFFDEFVAPYLLDISRRLGPLVVHSCGDFRHMIPSLRRLGVVEGVNASQLSVRELVDASLDRDTVLTMIAMLDTAPEAIRSAIEGDLHVGVSVYGPYPVGPDGKGKPSDQWSQAERDDFRAAEERILQAACRAPSGAGVGVGSA